MLGTRVSGARTGLFRWKWVWGEERLIKQKPVLLQTSSYILSRVNKPSSSIEFPSCRSWLTGLLNSNSICFYSKRENDKIFVNRIDPFALYRSCSSDDVTFYIFYIDARKGRRLLQKTNLQTFPVFSFPKQNPRFRNVVVSLYKRTKYGICNKAKEPLKRTEY